MAAETRGAANRLHPPSTKHLRSMCQRNFVPYTTCTTCLPRPHHMPTQATSHAYPGHITCLTQATSHVTSSRRSPTLTRWSMCVSRWNFTTASLGLLCGLLSHMSCGICSLSTIRFFLCHFRFLCVALQMMKMVTPSENVCARVFSEIKPTTACLLAS